MRSYAEARARTFTLPQHNWEAAGCIPANKNVSLGLFINMTIRVNGLNNSVCRLVVGSWLQQPVDCINYDRAFITLQLE